MFCCVHIICSYYGTVFFSWNFSYIIYYHWICFRRFSAHLLSTVAITFSSSSKATISSSQHNAFFVAMWTTPSSIIFIIRSKHGLDLESTSTRFVRHSFITCLTDEDCSPNIPTMIAVGASLLLLFYHHYLVCCLLCRLVVSAMRIPVLGMSFLAICGIVLDRSCDRHGPIHHNTLWIHRPQARFRSRCT